MRYDLGLQFTSWPKWIDPVGYGSGAGQIWAKRVGNGWENGYFNIIAILFEFDTCLFVFMIFQWHFFPIFTPPKISSTDWRNDLKITIIIPLQRNCYLVDAHVYT